MLTFKLYSYLVEKKEPWFKKHLKLVFNEFEPRDVSILVGKRQNVHPYRDRLKGNIVVKLSGSCDDMLLHHGFSHLVD